MITHLWRVECVLLGARKLSRDYLSNTLQNCFDMDNSVPEDYAIYVHDNHVIGYTRHAVGLPSAATA